MHSRLCACYILWVLLGWIGFLSMMLFIVCTSHVHAFSCISHFFSFLVPCLLLWLCFSLLYLSRLVFFSWHLKSLFHLKTQFVVVLLLLLLLLFLLSLFDSMIRRHEMTSLRTFLTRRFIQNAKSFCLISQTLLHLVHLALKDGLLYVRNPRGVPTCSYKSFTPTCTPSILLYLGLLQYSVVYVSQSTRNLFSRYYVSRRWIIRITLVMRVSLPSLETSWPHSSVRRPCYGEV